MVPGTKVSAQVFHVNSLGAWVDWVGIKNSTPLTEKLLITFFWSLSYFLWYWLTKQKSLAFEQCLCCKVIVTLRAHVPDLPCRGIYKRKTQYLQIWLAGYSELQRRCLVEFLGENSMLPSWGMWGCCQASENQVLQSWTVRSLTLPFIWAISALAEHEITERQQVLCDIW